MQTTLTKALGTLLFFAASLAALAQSTGRIEGTYQDAKTQEGIFGGTVRLENTAIAGPTDDKGHYVLPNVP
ncbi:MAG: hypothetical protein EOO63_13895, partial [Hymenobacter sp.]